MTIIRTVQARELQWPSTMKVFVIKESDIENLRLRLKRDSRDAIANAGVDLSAAKLQQAFDAAHRFYVYQIETWLSEVTK